MVDGGGGGLDRGPKQHPRAAFKRACVDAQQASEKALKAFLLARQGRIPKTHDLEDLLGRIRSADPSFPARLPFAQALTKYYFLMRYPDTRPAGWTPVTSVEAAEALQMAETIVADVRARIAPPPPAPPPNP